MRKQLLLAAVVVVMVLMMASTCFAATFKVERVRVDSTNSEVRALMKNTSNNAMMFVYVPDTLRKEILATLLSAAASDFEMYIGLASSGGKLYFTYVEPCDLSQ